MIAKVSPSAAFSPQLPPSVFALTIEIFGAIITAFSEGFPSISTPFSRHEITHSVHANASAQPDALLRRVEAIGAANRKRQISINFAMLQELTNFLAARTLCGFTRSIIANLVNNKLLNFQEDNAHSTYFTGIFVPKSAMGKE